jgi:VanZ family protein
VLIAYIWMAAIFYVSSQPAPELSSEPLLDTILKKLAHAAAYAILAFLVARALDRSSGSRTEKHRPPREGAAWQWRRWMPAPSVWAWAIATLYAITDEIHQGFVPTRHPMPTDVLIDSVGAAIAMLVLAGIHRSGGQPANSSPT